MQEASGVSSTTQVSVTIQGDNDVSLGTNNALTFDEDSLLTLSAVNFGYTNVDSGDSLTAVRIDTLPSVGTLTLTGSDAVSSGQVITVADINSGKLIFTPTANANGSAYATIAFSASDASNAFDGVPNTITENVTAVNDTPVDIRTGTSNVSVSNFSFQQSSLGDGSWAQGSAGWTFSALGGGEYNPLTSAYASGNGSDGSNVAFLNSGISMWQTLGFNFATANNYQLLVDIGSQLNFAADAQFRVRLYAGATVIGQYTNTMPNRGTWGTISIDVDGSTYTSADGQALRIVIENLDGTKVNIDNVRLTTSTATGSIAENSIDGTTVVTASVLDRDPSNTFTYSLFNSAGGRFAINSTTGVVSVADQSLLNYESATSHNIVVRATDQAGLAFDRTLSVSLTDVNEFAVTAPTDSNATANAVNENAANGTVFGIVTFESDDDATTNEVTYTLDVNAGGRFTINSSTGVVTVADGTLRLGRRLVLLRILSTLTRRLTRLSTA